MTVPAGALMLAAVLLVVIAMVSCSTTGTGSAIDAAPDDGSVEQFGPGLLYSSCSVRSGTDDMTDSPWHLLTCLGPVAYDYRGHLELLCWADGDPPAWRLAARVSPVDSGMVEYRFDDQPIVREQWQLDGRRAVSVVAAPKILEELNHAARFRFRANRGTTTGTTTTIGLTDEEGDPFGAAAAAAFIRRCEETDAWR